MIDTNHPDYPKMKKEYDNIIDQLEQKIKEIDARCPEWKGRDHPYGDEKRAAIHDATTAINQLLQKYPL